MSNRITEKLLFSPTNIPGCTLWLDAADPNTVVGTSPVTNWKDKSGKGYDLSSRGGTPQYVNYGPGMSIYLNNAYLAVPTIAGGVNLANYSFFIVSLSQTAVYNQTAFSSSTAGYYNYGSPYDISFFIDSDSGSQLTRFYSNGAQVLNSIPTTTIAQPLNLMSYTGNSAGAFSSWVNGNTGSTSASGARASGATSFSAGGNWNQSAWQTYANVVCNLYEVVVYTTVLTTAQRQQVEGYLTWKWGLQGSLPSNHPYKNVAPSFPLNTVTSIVQGTFSPTSISGLTAWFDGSDPAGTGTPPSNGASISTWVDKSGSSHNAVAGGAPTFAAASLNGLGTLTFNGTTNYLYASGLTVPTNTHSLFAVHNPVTINGAATPPGDTGILRAQETVGYIVFPYSFGTNYGYTTSFISGFFGFGFQNDTAGAWNLYETVVGSSAVTQYQYGTVVTANTGLSITATTSDNFTVGSYSSFGGGAQQFYWGSMAEVLVFNVELSTTDRQTIEGYLAWKWGKQASLSPSHPYYSAAPTSSTSTTVNVPWIIYKAPPPPFTPLNIVGLQLWLDAADPNGNNVAPANGATLSTWVDKSGNARNATVAPGKIAGTYSTSNRAVNFAASNTGYVTSYTANPSLETMFVVFNNPSPSFNNNMVIGGPQGARSLSGGYAGGGAGVGASSYLNNQVAWSGMASMPAGTYTSGTTVITTGQVNGLTTSISQNGGTIYSNTTTFAFSNVTTYLGTDFASPSFYYIGFEMEVIFYNFLLSLSQRQQVEGYLAWKWGLQASLPPSHPYYSAAPLGVYPYSSISNSISVKYFSPLSIAGLQLWLDGQDTSSMSFSGSTITTWRDKSGNGNNATATGTPTLSTAGGFTSSYRTIYLNGSSWFLGSVNISSTTSLTAFVVTSFALTSSASSARVLSLASAGQADWNNTASSATFYQDYATANISIYRNGAYLSAAVGQNTPVIGTCVYDGTSNYLYKNGASQTPVNSTGTFAISIYGIGNQAVPSGETLNGYIGEVIVFNTALTTAQRQRVEGYLAWEWGLQANLPSIHPFRNYPPPP